MISKKNTALSVSVLILNAIIFIPPVAAEDDVFQDSGSWSQIVGEGSLGFIDPKLSKARIWLEGQARVNDDFGHFYQGMVRAAVGYSITDRATLWAGYTWLPTENIGKPYVNQQDVWPAFRYVLPTDYGPVTFRTMLESNFIPGSDVRFRPRQMVKFMHPFEFQPKLSFITWDEFFIRVNTTASGQAGFDQNRAFVGLGWTFNKNFRLEGGYMNQYLDDATHTNNTMRHLAMVSLFMNF
ncbi:DUF2490 domain-containing protein [Crenothrix sp.]|uniref:DUF2490 domain-containing protein n=1 Tax=Crenothrix sp. TaxID=3100433 RepID=UPI00374DB16F